MKELGAERGEQTVFSLPVNSRFLPRAPVPAPPPEAQVQVCTSTSPLICLRGIWVLLGFFQPGHLPQKVEVSLEASSPLVTRLCHLRQFLGHQLESRLGALEGGG